MCQNTKCAVARARADDRAERPLFRVPPEKMSEEEEDPTTVSWPEGFSPCYVIWIAMIIFSFGSYTRATIMAKRAQTIDQLRAAARRWDVAKRHSFILFVLCSVMHFATGSWVEDWVGRTLMLCILLMVILPVCYCAQGDKNFRLRAHLLRTEGRDAALSQLEMQRPPRNHWAEQLHPVVADATPVTGVPIVEASNVVAHAAMLPPAEATSADVLVEVPSAELPLDDQPSVEPPVASASTPASSTPTMAEMCTLFRRQLALDGALNMKETVDAAAEQLGVTAEGSVMHRAKLVWEALGSPNAGLTA